MREMKDSGVEWIGKIPKDWEIVPLTKQLDSIVAVYGIQRSPFCFRTAVFRNQRPPIF